MTIGPYTSVISDKIDIDVFGVKNMDDSYFPSPDEELISLARIDLGIERPKDDRSFLGGKISVNWSLNIKERRYGIWEMSIDIHRIYGYLNIEDLPVNSLGTDEDEELEEFEIEIDSNKGKWAISIEEEFDHSWELEDGFSIYAVTIDFEDNSMIARCS